MIAYRNIYLLGTSHIAQESIDKVSEFIESKKPDIVAIELDQRRAHALFNKRKLSIKDITHLGVKGFLINLIGAYIEKKLGKLVGVTPGSEMKIAITLAKKQKLRIALIDQDIGITLNKLSKSITWKEKLRFVKDIVKGIITRKPQIESFDLRKIPPKETIEKMIQMVKESYPNVYNVLIEERNQVMAKNLNSLMSNNPDKTIFAIVGAGHEEGIIQILKRNTR